MLMGKKMLSAGLAVLVLGLFAVGVSRVEDTADREGVRQLERALRQAAVACYAAEGIYPPNVDYLCRHYGVLVNEERYTVIYEIFADNLMPAILVLEDGT